MDIRDIEAVAIHQPYNSFRKVLCNADAMCNPQALQLDPPDYASAKSIYTDGKNSERGDGLRDIQTFSTAYVTNTDIQVWSFSVFVSNADVSGNNADLLGVVADGAFCDPRQQLLGRVGLRRQAFAFCFRRYRQRIR